MADDKPLHVRVAEALGWTDCRFAPAGNLTGFGGTDDPVWIGGRAGTGLVNETIPRYDTDWAATGPLIEQFDVWLSLLAGVWTARCNRPGMSGWSGYADTPLLAVCRMILALAEAGKLPKEG